MGFGDGMNQVPERAQDSAFSSLPASGVSPIDLAISSRDMPPIIFSIVSGDISPILVMSMPASLRAPENGHLLALLLGA